MISAFGVEHTVSKSWKKMGPKYASALANMTNKGGKASARHTYRKMRYAQGRIDLGEQGSVLNGPTKARALTRIKQRQAKDAYRTDLDDQLGKTTKKRELP